MAYLSKLMDTFLRDQLNATLTRRWDIAPGLAIFRVEPHGELPPFLAGQYYALGLPSSCPRVLGSDLEPPREKETMVRRAYSIASSSKQHEYLEFYITLVQSGELTPRLFGLQPGDRLWLSPRAKGMFTLQQVPHDRDLFLISTGTGLAPYISMLRGELADREGGRRIVIAHGARHSWDLGYRAELEVQTRRRTRLSYIPSITRPSEDPSWKGETGYLQQQVQDGRLESLSGVPLDAARAHVFLCGNPAMITALMDLLGARGFSECSRKDPKGQIHTEKYW